jgi:hypothetical protein
VASAPEPPRSAVIAVVGDVLVIIAGSRPEESLTAFRARSSGPTPAALPREAAPLVGGFDVGVLTSPPSESTPVQGYYRATRDGDVVTARGRVTVPSRAMSVVRTILTSRMEQQRRERGAPPRETTAPAPGPAHEVVPDNPHGAPAAHNDSARPPASGH